MLRRTSILAFSLAALAGNAIPAHAAEVNAAVVNVWLRLDAWTCGSGCFGGYHTDDWIRFSSTGLTGGPDGSWDSWSDSSSSLSVYTTNCVLDSVFATTTTSSGLNPGTINLSFSRVGEPSTASVFVGSLNFTSANGVGSGSYTIVVPATGELTEIVDQTNACLAGPRTDAAWSGNGLAARAVI